MTQGPHVAAPDFIEVGAGTEMRRIACRTIAGADPLVLWLGGYRSDMLGTKAERLADLAAREGLGFCRFDYSGHGESGGRFIDGTISRWTDEAEAVMQTLDARRIVIVGSSMGGWIALRLIERLRESGDGACVQGLVLLAPAPDFTRRLVEPALTDAQRNDLETQGFFAEPSAYSPEPNIYTKALIDDGAENLMMDALIETGCPVHILQGMADPDVPYTHALELVSLLPADGVVLTLIRDGDHRLSREIDLERIEAAVLGLAGDPERR